MWLIFAFVFLVLFIFGLCEFLHYLYLFFVFPKRSMNSTLVVMLNKKNAIKQIVYAGEQLRWLGDKYADRVLVVAEDFDEDLLNECELLALKYNLKLVVKGRK